METNGDRKRAAEDAAYERRVMDRLILRRQAKLPGLRKYEDLLEQVTKAVDSNWQSIQEAVAKDVRYLHIISYSIEDFDQVTTQHDKVAWILNIYWERSDSSQVPVRDRRRAWDALRSFVRTLDNILRQAQQREQASANEQVRRPSRRSSNEEGNEPQNAQEESASSPSSRELEANNNMPQSVEPPESSVAEARATAAEQQLVGETLPTAVHESLQGTEHVHEGSPAAAPASPLSNNDGQHQENNNNNNASSTTVAPLSPAEPVPGSNLGSSTREQQAENAAEIRGRLLTNNVDEEEEGELLEVPRGQKSTDLREMDIPLVFLAQSQEKRPSMLSLWRDIQFIRQEYYSSPPSNQQRILDGLVAKILDRGARFLERQSLDAPWTVASNDLASQFLKILLAQEPYCPPENSEESMDTSSDNDEVGIANREGQTSGDRQPEVLPDSAGHFPPNPNGTDESSTQQNVATQTLEQTPTKSPAPANLRPTSSPVVSTPLHAEESEPLPPLPSPVSFKDTTVIPADRNDTLLSGSLYVRPEVSVSYRFQMLPPELVNDTKLRLAKWNPYWYMEADLRTTCTSPVNSSAVRNRVALQNNQGRIGQPKTIVTCSVDISPEILYKLSTHPDQYAVLLQTLPLRQDLKRKKQKRADGHLWPKGSFVTIHDTPLRDIQQRKQQSHDWSEWKGLSAPRNLTSEIADIVRQAKAGSEVRIPLAICSYDPDLFLVNIALCRKRTVSSIFEDLMCTKISTWSDNGYTLPPIQRLSVQQSSADAIRLARQQVTTLLDSDDEHDTTRHEDVGKIVFTLTCPISMSLIKTPVRGSRCKHWQCFDLYNFLQSNARISGGRWRCACCESFLSIDDLVVCGLTLSILENFSSVAIPSKRDRIEFRGDGSYVLLPENKKRYKQKLNPPVISNLDSGSNGPGKEIMILD